MNMNAALYAQLCITHLYLEEIYEIIVFVEVTASWASPREQSPQADSMVLFGAFCNFLCIKNEKKTVPK